jgi:hypothetical protein
MEKPKFTTDQLVPASHAAKSFGQLRKKAKYMPQYITDNGVVGEVLLDYQYFEELFGRLKEYEALEEKRKNWKYAVDLNQIDGPYKPSSLLDDLVEKKNQGKVSSDDIVKRLVEEYEERE